MMKRVFLAGACAAALTLFAVPASAQQAPGCTADPQAAGCGPLLIDVLQVQNNAVSATVFIDGQTIVVTPPPTDGSPVEVTATAITALTTGIGNNLTAQSQGATAIEGTATQELYGNVTALSTVVTTAPVPGVITTATSAFGNTAQAEACCGGMAVGFNQTVGTGFAVTADSWVSTVQGLGTLSMSSTASANVVGASATNGPITLTAAQANGSTVNSWSRGEACCNTGSITVSSTAAANAVTSSSETSTVYTVVNQANTGFVSSTSDHSTNSGRVITSATQATGNSATLFNQWGYTDLRGTQQNENGIRAEGYLTANNYVDAATAGATGQANSAIVSSRGSDALIDLSQYNGFGGGVEVIAQFIAASPTGGVGLATATAAGNSITGYVCTSCGQDQVKIEGFTTQVNEANVTASTVMGAGTSGTLVGQATAVGNTANFIAQRGSH